MNRWYLLVFAFGIVSGLATAFAARPYQAEKLLQLDVTAGQQATIESWAQARFCPQVDEEFGLSGPQACAGNKSFQKLDFVWITNEEGVRKLKAEARVTIRGEWTPQSAD